MKKILLIGAMTMAALAGCETVDTMTESTVNQMAYSAKLDTILAAQPEKVQARYQYRNPKETIEYFGIEPGMTVAEVLPGRGWYTKILMPYLGEDGHIVGIDYSIDHWSKFGGFATEEFLEGKKTWAAEWAADAAEWRNGVDTKISAFAFGSAPADMTGQVDVIFLPRAIHHLNRFEQANLGEAMMDMKKILKPDGVVAVVAHRASEDNDDDWANGDNGYMKESTVVQIMNEAGFELVGSSEINANPKDKASSANEDMVWRLPPTLATSRDNPELKAKMEAIGETDRMTLKFKLK